MAMKDLKIEPHQTIDEDVWWYEENKGIELRIDCICPSGQRDHKVLLIPWYQIRAALARKDK